jgi:hypothetical protein
MRGNVPLTPSDNDRAVRLWNEQQPNQASSATYAGFDRLFVLRDSTGHVLGAVTRDGSIFSQDELRAYRVMASCRR